MKENTENAQSDDIGKKKELRSGALRSSLTIELHTRYAIQLWTGREADARGDKGQKGKWRIIGMPFFLHLANRINEASVQDDPYADGVMLKLEDTFSEGNRVIEQLVNELDIILRNVPSQISLSSVGSVSPVNIGVFSRTPVGYRCVWLLVGFDQLALKAFQAAHYGLISHRQRDEYLHRAGSSIRKIFGIALHFQRMGVTRLDVIQNTPLALEATKLMGEVSFNVLSGKSRSSFSPPINQESIELLLAANEKADKADIVQLLEDPPEGRIVVDPSLNASDSKRIDD